MTYAKTDIFDEKLQALASASKAVAHPARWAILLYLAEQKSCISGDITKELPLSRATVSQHLQELKEQGFIRGTVEGKNVCYCLNPAKLAEVIALIQEQSQPLINYLYELEQQSATDSCC
jgi:predicted transcriptional regulator